MKKYYLIGTLLLLIPILGIILYSSIKSDDSFSENLIVFLTDRLEKDLTDLMGPVRQEILRISNEYSEPGLILRSEDTLAHDFISRMSGIPVLGTIVLFDGIHNSFTIYREKNTYVSSLHQTADSISSISWTRRRSDQSIAGSWHEVLAGQEERELALAKFRARLQDDEEVIWTGMYHSNLLREPVLTFVVKWFKEDSGVVTCAIEIPLDIVIRHLSSFNNLKRRRIFIATETQQLIYIPSSIPDSIQTLDEKINTGTLDLIEDSLLLKFTGSWFELGANPGLTFHQKIGSEDWWVHVREFPAIEMGAVGLAIPEGSLKIGMLLRSYQVLLAVILSIISVLIFIVASRQRRKKQTKSSAGGDPINWVEVIARGESREIEFKSSLRWDQHLGKINPRLEDVIVKSVAAFSNGDGGTLLVGVADDGKILGLEGDFNSLKKNDADYFEIHLRNLLRQAFGVTFITRNLSIDLPELEQRVICAVRISRGTEPAYVTTTDKNGNKTERFYVRSGNSSQEIQSLKEINDYISQRFSK